MKKFSSYGPVDKDIHFYSPRKQLINKTYDQLIGDNPLKGGSYITVWAPRQSGKTWVMQQVLSEIKKNNEFECGIITLQSAKNETTDEGILSIFTQKLSDWFDKDFPEIATWKEFSKLFTKKFFSRPLILIIDEFDALQEDFINKFANQFRDMYLSRQNEESKQSQNKKCLLHGLALVGVRSVLGIENVTGSPFNIQRSVHIPNLSFKEVDTIFKWYEKDSGQKIEQNVIDKIYYEFRGQPGLTCWFGELITEGNHDFVVNPQTSISMDIFNEAYLAAISILPNNNILNIISKAKQKPYVEMVLELFKTDHKIDFTYDDSNLNFLYMNGVIDKEKVNKKVYYVKFTCPFIQKRLFNFFSREFFSYMGKLVEPFENTSELVANNHINIQKLIKRYEKYLKKNRQWLLKNAPKRKDLRIFEAVYHFNLFMYLYKFLSPKNAEIYPEFPTGNGKIDIIINYGNCSYGIELKSFSDESSYHEALKKASNYGIQLGLKEITIVFFIEYIDDANREKYQTEYYDNKNNVKVLPIFVETGN